MLNVLVLIHYFHEDKLGGFRRVANVLESEGTSSSVQKKHHTELGRQFTFLVPSHRVDGNWASRSGAWSEVEPQAIPFRWPLKGEFFGWLRYSKEYIRCLRNSGQKIDVVYIIAPPAWWSVVGLLTAKTYGIPVVVDLGDSAASQANGLFSHIAHRVSEGLLRRCSRTMILASPKLKQNPTDKVLHTGIGNEFFSVGEQRLAMNQFQGKNNPLVVYTGTVGPLQNIEAFLNLWRKIVAVLPNATFQLYGLKEDSAGKQLLRHAESLQFKPEQVILSPRINPEQIAEKLLQADWGLVCLDCVPKLEYAVPTKLLEYLAAGLPIFGFGGGQIEQTIQHTGSGVYVSPKNFQADRVAENLSADRASFVKAAYHYATANLGKNEYKQSVRRVLRQAGSKWSATVQRGIDWLEREVLIPPQELGFTSGETYTAMRHSGKNPRIQNAYHWAYPEITAYQISLLVNLYYVSGNERFIAQARCLARWLVHLQDKETGAIPFVFELNTREPQYPSWSFDVGMILRAFDLFLAVDCDDEVKQSRELTVKWLLSFQQENGSFKAAKFLDSSFSPPQKNHYSDGGALHIKLLLALPDLNLGETPYSTAREKLLNWVNEFQHPDGRFSMYPETEIVFNHTHQYALEGLFGEAGFSERWEQGMQWALALRSKNHGWLPRSTNSAESLPAGDATGQFFRQLAFGAFRRSPNLEHYKLAADELANQLRKSQLPCGAWGESINYGNQYGAPVWVTQLTLAGFLAHECPSEDLELF